MLPATTLKYFFHTGPYGWTQMIWLAVCLFWHERDDWLQADCCDDDDQVLSVWHWGIRFACPIWDSWFHQPPMHRWSAVSFLCLWLVYEPSFDVRNEDHYNKICTTSLLKTCLEMKCARFQTSGLLLVSQSRRIAHYLCLPPSLSWRPAWQVSPRKTFSV